MSLTDRLRGVLPFLSAPLKLQPELMRSLHPVRNPAARWERQGQENLIVIYAPRPPLQAWQRVLAQLTGEPPAKKIELADEISSFVWEQCDGISTVGDICHAVSARYKLGSRQTEIPVLQFLNMLRSRRLIGLPAEDQRRVADATAAGAQRPNIPQTRENSIHGQPTTKRKRIGSRRIRRH